MTVDIILKLFPIKKTVTWAYIPRNGMERLVGLTTGYQEEYCRESGGRYTIFGSAEGRTCCLRSEYIDKILSANDLEKDILEQRAAKERAEACEKQKSTGRTVAKVAAVAGCGVIAMMGVRVRAKTVRGVENGIRDFFGLEASEALNFNEQEYRKRYVPIISSDKLAKFSSWNSIDYFRDDKVKGEIFRGVPSNYVGNFLASKSITYRISDDYNGYPKYKIIEYCDEHTATEVWIALLKYGFIS